MHTQNIGSRSFAFSLCFWAVTAVLGAPGELDPTFGTNGLVRIDVEQIGDAAAAVFAQADAGATGGVGITAVNDNAGVLQFGFVDLTVAEGDIRSELRVTRTGGSTGAVSAHFGSYGVTATEGLDYWSLEGTLWWGHGATGARSIRVNATTDGEDAEADERFRVVLRRPTGGATLGAAAVAEVTIDESLEVPPNGSAAPSGGGGTGGVLEVLVLGLALLASLFKVPASPRRRASAKPAPLGESLPLARS